MHVCMFVSHSLHLNGFSFGLKISRLINSVSPINTCLHSCILRLVTYKHTHTHMHAFIYACIICLQYESFYSEWDEGETMWLKTINKQNICICLHVGTHIHTYIYLLLSMLILQSARQQITEARLINKAENADGVTRRCSNYS